VVDRNRPHRWAEWRWLKDRCAVIAQPRSNAFNKEIGPEVLEPNTRAAHAFLAAPRLNFSQATSYFSPMSRRVTTRGARIRSRDAPFFWPMLKWTHYPPLEAID